MAPSRSGCARSRTIADRRREPPSARRRRASPGPAPPREAAEAAVREAEARRDLARARSRIARDPDAHEGSEAHEGGTGAAPPGSCRSRPLRAEGRPRGCRSGGGRRGDGQGRRRVPDQASQPAQGTGRPGGHRASAGQRGGARSTGARRRTEGRGRRQVRPARLEVAEANLKAVEAEAGGTGPGPRRLRPRLPSRIPSTNLPRRSFRATDHDDEPIRCGAGRMWGRRGAATPDRMDSMQERRVRTDRRQFRLLRAEREVDRAGSTESGRTSRCGSRRGDACKQAERIRRPVPEARRKRSG